MIHIIESQSFPEKSQPELFELRSDEAMSLKIVERFFGEVSNYLLREPEPSFDVAGVKALLSKLKPGSATEETVEAVDRELRCELRTWREHLILRDLDVEAFEIRRFCDAFRSSLDPSIFYSVARFYRSLPISSGSQCKFDLVMTRGFEGERIGSSRFVKYERATLESKIVELFSTWPEIVRSMEKMDPVEADATGDFDQFLAEADRLEHFEHLIASNIFERIRDFKRSLGPAYFTAANVAAAIETNIIVGNTFDALLGRLNSNLHQRLNSEIDFAGAMIDGPAAERPEVADIFGKFADSAELKRALGTNSDLALLRVLVDQSNKERDIAARHEKSDEDSTGLVKERLAPLLQTLAMEQPDMSMLREYMRPMPTLDSIDLTDFLYHPDGKADPFGRRALAAILCLAEFRETDLKVGTMLTTELNDEVFGILHFAESLGTELTYQLKTCGADSRARLLLIANQLLNSRLQVERAVVRYSAPLEVEPVREIEVEEPSAFEAGFEVAKTSLLESNRWLVGATIAVLMFGAFFFLFSGQSSSASILGENVKEISTVLLPTSDHLEQALVRNDTLFVTAKPTWEKLSEVERSESLKSMLIALPDQPLKVAIVIDGNGRPLGDISPSGINLNSEAKIEENK